MPSPTAVKVSSTQAPTPQSTGDKRTAPRRPLLPIKSAHVIWVTFLTIFPWTVVAVFDAIDHQLRPRRVVAVRLLLSTVFIVVAYTIGILYAVELVLAGDEWSDCAAVLVAMFFNLYVRFVRYGCLCHTFESLLFLDAAVLSAACRLPSSFGRDL